MIIQVREDGEEMSLWRHNYFLIHNRILTSSAAHLRGTKNQWYNKSPNYREEVWNFALWQYFQQKKLHLIMLDPAVIKVIFKVSIHKVSLVWFLYKSITSFYILRLQYTSHSLTTLGYKVIRINLTIAVKSSKIMWGINILGAHTT